MEQAIITYQGKDTGRKALLAPAIFGIEPNEHVMYLDVKRLRAAQRKGTHKTKSRGEVRGSTQKIQKQKGSGKARKGDKKSGILRGGGHIHSLRPHSYAIKINQKTSQLARRSALSIKAQNNKITILEPFTFSQPKTKTYVQMLKSLSCHGQKTLLILPHTDTNMLLSASNIPHARVMNAAHLNTYAILHASHLLVSEAALTAIQEQLA